MTFCDKIRQRQYSNSERYKSAGERRIAEFLTRRNIAFTYEKPLAVVNEGQVRIFYPDYTLHDLGTIIEYFGINGNPDDYIARTNRKIDAYQKNHVPFIPVYPQDFTGNWQENILKSLQSRIEHQHGLLAELQNQVYAGQ